MRSSSRAPATTSRCSKNDRVGGLLRYGIPDFKMEKWLIDRRVEQMRAEGVVFRLGVYVGTERPGKGVPDWASETVAADRLLAEFDAVVLAGGAEQPRDLPIAGRELDGVHFAMEFLPLRRPPRSAGNRWSARRRRPGRSRPVGDRQARHHHRRRRYRLGLRRHLQPPRREIGYAVRTATHAARRR